MRRLPIMRPTDDQILKKLRQCPDLTANEIAKILGCWGARVIKLDRKYKVREGLQEETNNVVLPPPVQVNDSWYDIARKSSPSDPNPAE